MRLFDMPRKTAKSERSAPLGRHFLKAWRQYRGMTQEQAEEFLGMDRSNLSRIENGRLPYDQRLLENAARAYGCTVAELLVRDPRDQSGAWALVEALERLRPDQREMIARMVMALDEERAA